MLYFCIFQPPSPPPNSNLSLRSSASQLADKKKVEESLQQENKKLEAELDAKPEDFDPPPSSARVKYEILKALKKSRMDDLKKLGEAIGKLWSEVRGSFDSATDYQARFFVLTPFSLLNSSGLVTRSGQSSPRGSRRQV